MQCVGSAVTDPAGKHPYASRLELSIRWSVFVRFVVGTSGENHRWLTGVIAEARLLRDDDALERYEVEWLEETYAWLNAHLPCPPFRESDWSRDAVCWFKDNAGESITRVWGIVALLREHGLQVRVLRSRNPGKILYEDDYQVVVEEWRSL